MQTTCLIVTRIYPGSTLFLFFFFFSIFISDLLNVVCSVNIIALYADDCKTSMVIANFQDHALFQDDLNNLWSWSNLSRMARIAQPVETDLCMNESPLEVVSEFKDSGLFIDSNLSWNIHMLKRCLA